MSAATLTTLLLNQQLPVGVAAGEEAGALGAPHFSI